MMMPTSTWKQLDPAQKYGLMYMGKRGSTIQGKVSKLSISPPNRVDIFVLLSKSNAKRASALRYVEAYLLGEL